MVLDAHICTAAAAVPCILTIRNSYVSTLQRIQYVSVFCTYGKGRQQAGGKTSSPLQCTYLHAGPSLDCLPPFERVQWGEFVPNVGNQGRQKKIKGMCLQEVYERRATPIIRTVLGCHSLEAALPASAYAALRILTILRLSQSADPEPFGS